MSTGDYFVLGILMGIPYAILIAFVVFMRRKIRKLTAAYNAVQVPKQKTFKLRILDSSIPETMPILYSDSEALYYAARYGAGGDWYNLLTIVSRWDGDYYNIEIKAE